MADASDWIGRSETATDSASPRIADGLAAVLDHGADRPWPAGEIPPLGHWLMFQPMVPQSRIGADGHPARGGDGLIPAIALPRRMWAGGRLRFLAPIPTGAEVTRVSTLASAERKHGRSGEMLFLTIRHVLSVGGAAAIEEEQDIVYRDHPAAGSPLPETPPAPAAPVGRTIIPDPVLLFRYSALTLNGHRIHYDRDFARNVEGYPGLVVHGPLLATLLVDLFARTNPARPIRGFRFRAMRPVFDGAPFAIGCDGTQLHAATPEGALAMKAEVVAG